MILTRFRIENFLLVVEFLVEPSNSKTSVKALSNEIFEKSTTGTSLFSACN